ncbi:MAG: hexosaminidase, partial [Flavobacteriales bacterium]
MAILTKQQCNVEFLFINVTELIPETLLIRFLLVLCLSVISLSACNGKNTITDEGSELTQAMVDQLAETLDIQYSVVVNKGSGGCTPQWGGEPCFVADIHITSQIQTQARGWTIYYSQSDKFEESHDREFIVEHINGDLVSIKPGDMYQGFKTGETKIVRTISNGLVFAEAKMMPNYYISADGLEARVISSTKLNVDIDTGLEERPYATNIDPKTQFQRENDNTPVATSGYLYHQNKDIQLDSSAVAIGVIPKPKSMTITDGVLDLSMGYTVKGDEVSVKAAGAAIIRFKAMGFRESKHGHPLGLDIDSTLTLPKGSYSLSVKASGISIVGV